MRAREKYSQRSRGNSYRNFMIFLRAGANDNNKKERKMSTQWDRAMRARKYERRLYFSVKMTI